MTLAGLEGRFERQEAEHFMPVALRIDEAPSEGHIAAALAIDQGSRRGGLLNPIFEVLCVREFLRV